LVSLRYAQPIEGSSYKILIARPKHTPARKGKFQYKFTTSEEKVSRTKSRDSLKSNNSSLSNTPVS